MEKEKILEMSRQENKDRDIVAQEAEKKANADSVMVTMIFSAILWIWQVITKNGSNDSIIAICQVMCAAISFSYYSTLKSKKCLISALCFTISAIVFTVSAIMGFYN